jgi:tetratricopeptide (TPR) repeat protein
VATPAAIVLITLGCLTYHQVGYWRDGETLWKYALTVTDRNYVAQDNLAMVFDGEGKPDEAISEFRASEAIHDYPPDQILKIGLYEQRNGHPQGAIEQYQKVSLSSATPALRAIAWTQIGSAYSQMADYPQAEQSYQQALKLNSDGPPALMAEGLLIARTGDYSGSATLIRRAMKIEPTDVGYLIMAEILEQAGSTQEAQEAEDAARLISRNLDEARKSASQTQLFFGYRPTQRVIHPTKWRVPNSRGALTQPPEHFKSS